jgi:hypothetical protein
MYSEAELMPTALSELWQDGPRSDGADRPGPAAKETRLGPPRYCAFFIYKITYLMVKESASRLQLAIFKQHIHNCAPLSVVKSQIISS